jgi:DNA polymerase I-like protein with 3'-5' exonuclease and polymerase domains
VGLSAFREVNMDSSIILTPERLAREVEYFGNQGEFFFDVESIPSEPGLDDRGVPARNSVIWMGMATHGRVIKIPMGHPIGNEIIGEGIEPRLCQDGKIRNYKVPIYSQPPAHMNQQQVFDLINPLFADPAITQIAHGATFDGASVAKYRPSPFSGKPLVPEGRLVCTIEMHHLTDENQMQYGLKPVTKNKYGFVYDDSGIGKTVERYRMNQVAQYLHYDLVYGFQEYKRCLPLIIADGLEEVWEWEVKLTTVLADMRTTGTAMDTVKLEELRGELSVLVDEREKAFYHEAGRKINLRSPQQIQGLLFKSEKDGGLGLKPWKMTKTGKKKVDEARKARKRIIPDHTFYSTDDESLDGFRGENPVIDALLKYRDTNKVYGTYVLGYLGDPDDKDKPCRVFDGIVYPDFVQYGAGTGRFSCRDPNLQNIPRPTGDPNDLATMIRGLFVARPGNKLIVADYGQIELVLLAHFIGYGAMWDGFLNGIDPHTLTAAMALGLVPEELQARVDAGDKEAKSHRQRFGKSINFATVYGAWIKKLASMMSVSMDEAQEFKDRYDQNTPEIEAEKEKVLREARCHSMRKTGKPPHTATLLGRMRRLPELMSGDQKIRNRAERQIFNAKIQGSSADLTKMAMVRFYSKKKEYWTINLTVHDEIVIECPEADVPEAQALLEWAMTGEGIQDYVALPLKIDLHVCSRWSQAK